MKTKNILKKFSYFLLADLLLISAITLAISYENHSTHDSAFAENLSSNSNSSVYPYTHTFTISAYYSPLPCQARYVTGSYEGDIRLNGSGVRGADGTPVYPGMIAAPKNYSFGTKMDIPGVGIVAVHDRGGAIVASNGKDGRYDRLDIWMGYGDKGLKRALNWGKRTMAVTVYGVNEGISEQVILGDYSSDEASANSCSPSVVNTDNKTVVTPRPQTEKPSLDFFGGNSVDKIDGEIVEKTRKDSLLTAYFSLGDSGAGVKQLQSELKRLNFYRADISGVYDEMTEHAVFKFQQSQGILGNRDAQGAGVFGPSTQAKLNEIVGTRNYTRVLIAEASEKSGVKATKVIAKKEDEEEGEEEALRTLLARELDLGQSGEDVKVLQEFLKQQGFFSSPLISDYYGEVTKKAVLEFQKKHGLVGNENDKGAGRIGPATLELINSLS